VKRAAHPPKFQREIWDNATEFEREFQSWQQLVTFPYDPTDSKATAFVVTVLKASAHTMHPATAPGPSHQGTVLRPSEQSMGPPKWQPMANS